MKSPEIEVGIMSEPVIEFGIEGKYKCVEVDGFVDGRFVARLQDGGICVEGEAVNVRAEEFVFLPNVLEQDCFCLKGVTIGVDFHWEQKEEQKFQGALKLMVRGGKIVAVNVLPVENYLVSVISSEMRADSSPALLKAHAVISRSWLLAQVRKQKGLEGAGTEYQSRFETETEYTQWWDREDHADFHVCADDHCQRYQGITRAENPNVAEAVRETSGVVLMYDGQIADARFSKCCGGVSELFENCWEPVHHDYLAKVVDNVAAPVGYEMGLEVERNADKWLRESPDAFCNTKDAVVLKQVLNDYDLEAKDFYRWKVEYSRGELSELIGRRSGKDFGEIVDLIPVERGASGRLMRLKVVGTKLSLTIGKELLIRRWLSESHLYSSAFVIDKVGDADGLPEKFVLSGGGWGHGVGLCQIGAAVMGHRGYSYQEILGHYFRGAGLSKEY